MGNADPGFLSTNDLILRAGPTIFYSVLSGRWSNPGTWDEGAQPGANDDAVVRHTVHAGYRRSIDAMYDEAELHPTTANTGLVRNISILNDPAYPDASLLWGGGSWVGALPTKHDVSAFELTPGGTITNNRVALTVAQLATAIDAGSGLFQGMSIFSVSTMRTNNLVNVGSMFNGGILEIGD